MKNKYLVVDVVCDEFWFVELTSAELKAMRWLAEKIDYDVRFFEMHSTPTFEEI